MHKKFDRIEYDKRIRIVQEWIIEDWHTGDIILQIVQKWKLSERQAKRYIAKARAKWADSEDEKIDRLRKLKIESLKKLKRSLKDVHKGTPHGIRAVLMVEKEIIKLENLAPAQKVEVTGKNGQPIKSETTHKEDIDYSKLSEDVLLAIAAARKTVT